MRFVIRTLNGPFPHPALGPCGNELLGYVPPAASWRQLNYGQGEGQVEIDGREWGIYQTGKLDELALHLHTGFCPAEVALNLVRQIAETLCCEEPFEIWLQGTEDSIV